MSKHETTHPTTSPDERCDEGQVVFAEIANGILDSVSDRGKPTARSEVFCTERCPDQWVGTVRLDAERLHYTHNDTTRSDQFSFRRPVGDLNPEGPRRLLMILESPHIDEFKSIAWSTGSDHRGAQREIRAIGPAAGATGANILALIAELHLSGVQELLMVRQGEDLDLVLINAIQHQTSLGHPTRCFRDKAFHLAWKTDRIGRANFQSRIEPLWRGQPRDVVVNCCTGGERARTSLKRLVYAALREITDNNSTLSPLVVGCAHPSSWRRNRNNRKAKVITLPLRQNLSIGVAHV